MIMAIFKIFLISVLLAAFNLSLAQSSIAPKGDGLSSSEIDNLREILKETPPLNSPQQQVDSFYKKQDAAAVRLGDMQERERVLKQWSSVSSDIDARWSYASFLMQTEKIQEGFEL
jgi:hypothetical protein